MHILWTIIIGFVAGVIAKLIYPGNKYEPTGYIWTTVLGIIGAFVATYLGQAVGWYQPDEGAGFIGAIVGAIIILTVWGFIAPRFRADLGARSDAASSAPTLSIGPIDCKEATDVMLPTWLFALLLGFSLCIAVNLTLQLLP